MFVPDIGLAGDLGSIPSRVIPKTQKMVLDASLLNTQHYKVRIKSKVEQSREGVAPSPTPWCSSYRKGNLRVTLDYGLICSYSIKCLNSSIWPLYPVGWDNRIHWLYLCRRVRPPPPQWVSWLWYQTIWWWGSNNAVALGNEEYSFLTISLMSTLARSGRVLSMGQIELLNWIVWNRTVWSFNCV